MSANSSASSPIQPLTGGALIAAAFMLALANFVAVLNMTIANVAVPNIAGSLAAATSQGTWVITSYAVGEAITVPLTGWLAGRFGSVKVFSVSLVMFGVFSFLCGVSNSLGMLVLMRIFQGLCGGPLMPLSQTLLLRIFPKEQTAAAIGLWSMTTLVAPVVGPILGGYLCDNASWNWVFIINVPLGIVFGLFSWRLLKRYQETSAPVSIDKIGLLLLVVWVAALQLVLDEGKNLDWFASTQIQVLSIVSFIAFVTFIIWELHERNPIVDLRVFRHRGFTISVITISFTFAAFFGVNVLIPLWLQSVMGYTATDAGLATAWLGVSGFLVAPFIAKAVNTTDPRKLVFIGIFGMGLITFWRTFANTDMAFWDVAIPLFVLGLCLPMFFIPVTSLALGDVEDKEMDSAAGLMNFLRTLSGAFATSIITTSWANNTTRNHAELVASSDPHGVVLSQLSQSGASAQQSLQTLDGLITQQSIMLSTNQITMALAVIFIFAASIIWLAPKPKRTIEPGAGGH